MDKNNEYYRPEWDDRHYSSGGLSSAKMEFFDFGAPTPKLEYTNKPFEIWIGYYHLGQGYDPPTEPQFLATVQAVDFKTACFKYELSRRLEVITELESKGDYISKQDYEWFYNPHSNSNSWTGPYYQTKEEAQKSFEQYESSGKDI